MPGTFLWLRNHLNFSFKCLCSSYGFCICIERVPSSIPGHIGSHVPSFSFTIFQFLLHAFHSNMHSDRYVLWSEPQTGDGGASISHG